MPAGDPELEKEFYYYLGPLNYSTASSFPYLTYIHEHKEEDDD